MPDTLTTPAEIRDHYGAPSALAASKTIHHLDRHARAFIALSPFVVIASADADGNCDATPRGDAPGFISVTDEHTLLIPDRRGNNRVDTLLNIAANPRIGLLFLVPGFGETLRVNGRVSITTDPGRLESLMAGGKVPSSAIVLAVDEVFFHCAKAMIRSEIWNPERHQDRASFPSLGRIIAEQVGGVNADTAEANIADSYRSKLY
jgi:PPOX class probable FMN-dependent enzyme